MQEKRLFPYPLSQATPRLHVSCSCFNPWHFSPANEYINYLFPHMTSAAFTSALRRSRSSMNGRLASMNNCQHPLICFRTASVFGTAWLRLQITCEYQHLEAVFIPQTTCSLRMLIWVVALTRILSVTRTTVTTNLTHKYTYILAHPYQRLSQSP